ncbi:TIM-barrel domain-containing protein [Streptomyces sp. NPDC049954]|uniref:TIM-barrel domain-containing protein n=1 Tax=Streptomyces sp. NPDC049954 TaxID=3155779 RepID=UPI003422D8C9
MTTLHPRAVHPFIAPPPTLTATGPGALDPVVRAEIAETAEDALTLRVRTEQGREGTLRLAAAVSGSVRVTLRMDGVPREPRVSLARPGRSTGRVVRDEHHVALATPGAVLRVDLDPFRMAFQLSPGTSGEVLRQNGDDRQPDELLTVLPLGVSELTDGSLVYHDTWAAAPEEKFYGFGEQFTGPNLRGRQVSCWIQDAMGTSGSRAYKVSPWLLSSRGYAVLVDTTTRAVFDLAHSNTAAWSFSVPDEQLDYYLIAGDPATCLGAHRELTGEALLPPDWAFGPWISSGFSTEDAAGVTRRAEEIREHGFPCSVIHIDCHWQKHGNWSDLRWDDRAFPDPKGLITSLRNQGLRTCLWMNPYIGVASPRFAEAERAGYLLRTADGTTWISDAWSGFHPEVAMVDFTRPEADSWYRELLREALSCGADAMKTDFGEGVPRDAVAANGMTGQRLHNLYPLLYNDLVSEVLREVTGGTGMVWGRSSWTGGQRHAVQWAGDPNSTWEDLASVLRGGLSLGLTGQPFWSHDIGGFHGTPSPELYVRWAQFGLLSPMARFHGMTSRLPWDFPQEACDAVREAALLRESLLPYLVEQAARCVRGGLPLMRPMFLDQPRRPDAHAADLQYLLGPDLLVAPLYAPGGRRQVWFPPGEWAHYATGEKVAGPQWREVALRLRHAPLWVRCQAGAPVLAGLRGFVEGSGGTAPTLPGQNA